MDTKDVIQKVQTYIDSVLSGDIVVNNYIKLAIQRHIEDLETGSERGLHFDIESGAKIVIFSTYLKHSKGKWAGTTVELEDWQCALLTILFGWKKANGLRRYKTVYLEIARKNGKTFLAAVVGLYLMVADKEAGAEIYAAATTRDQAKIVFDEATRMVSSSSALKKRITAYRNNLHIAGTATKFVPLGRDSKNLDGLNVHGAIVDELHAHKDSSVWDVLVTATGNRTQPMIFAITTAGFDKESYCYQLREYAISVLEKQRLDDSFFAAIFTLDEEDDWTNEETWVKANPNLGVTVSLDGLQDMAERAKAIQSEARNFKTKHLNMWLSSYFDWIDMVKWEACAQTINESSLVGRECYGGLDLSNTVDLTALVYIFPPIKNETAPIVISRCWIPQGKLDKKGVQDTVLYAQWAKDNHINVIPGEVIDYEFIYEQIRSDSKKFKIKEIGYDNWGSSSVYNTLSKENIEMVAVGQGFKSMSGAMKELERLIISEKIIHNSNPVLTWNMRNVIAETDAAGNIKPNKAKSKNKIDLVVALIMAMNIYMAGSTSAKKESIYNKRGLLSV